MKVLPAQLAILLGQTPARRNIGTLARYVALLVVMMTGYSIVFHYLMAYEDREYSWITGFYWTTTVMTTLGFGDITFKSDLGRAFSIVVMLSGVLFLLVLLPFTFIQFFYVPWTEAQAQARAPRQLPERTKGHVLLTNDDPVSRALIKRLRATKREYALIVEDLPKALALHDQGIRVAVGHLDDPETYAAVRASSAAMLVATQPDALNSNIAFTATTTAPHLAVVATAESEPGVEILRRAGATRVVRLSDAMGQALARCTLGRDAISHVVVEVDDVLIAEAGAARTPLVGRTLRENRLSDLGVNVLGVWERGVFTLATPETRVNAHSILVLAGSRAQLDTYDEHFAIYNANPEPALILGGGSVGVATAKALRERGIPSMIVERHASNVADPANTIVGDASQRDVLDRAGIAAAPAIIITTSDDSLNIYLAIYCRSLRPTAQIISRTTHERNVATLHRAGADHVLSYAHMGASIIYSALAGDRISTIAEGLEVFRATVSASLADRTIRDCGVREASGCSIVAVRGAGATVPLAVNPPATTRLNLGDELVIVGGQDAEARFRARFMVE
jgi:Trk K+ transport system NAD-binding subunit